MLLSRRTQTIKRSVVQAIYNTRKIVQTKKKQIPRGFAPYEEPMKFKRLLVCSYRECQFVRLAKQKYMVAMTLLAVI